MPLNITQRAILAALLAGNRYGDGVVMDEPRRRLDVRRTLEAMRSDGLIEEWGLSWRVTPAGESLLRAEMAG